MAKYQKKQTWKADFDYATNYDDHFETPLAAYRDITPILDWLMEDRGNHVVYDPYYCNGRTKRLMQGLGFSRTIHEKRDFYKDIRNNKLPAFQTLITNPPYSDQHKERCLEFAFSHLRNKPSKPFFLLMPNYVASRQYYRRICGDQDVAYLVPSGAYEYCHPEGTGKAVSPFSSVWFIGLDDERMKRLKEVWEGLNWTFDSAKPRLIFSLDELKEKGLIPTQKRPNPKQRNSRKRKHEDHVTQSMKTNITPNPSNSTARSSADNESLRKKKKSKYRDANGQRRKSRF